jgi:PAS domain S-box-containing protein
LANHSSAEDFAPASGREKIEPSRQTHSPGRDSSEQLNRERLEMIAPSALRALPAAVYMTDAAGRITFYNDAAAKLWGHRPELGEGQWCGSWRLRWPDGTLMPHDECPMAVALKTQKPIRGAEAIAERPDGTRVPFLAYPTPLFDVTGAMVGAVNLLIDVADRIDSERSQQLLAAIVESSDDAIISKDLDGIVRSWNRSAEFLFRYSAAEMIGQSITRIIPHDLLSEETEILRRIRAGERIEHYDTIRRRKDGSLVDVSITISPVRNKEGQIVGASKIARDIGERRRVQERQGLILREMNHRIRNLFALAGGLVTLTARHAETPEEMASSIRERMAALSRAHELTLPRLTPDGDTIVQPTSLAALLRTIVLPYLNGGIAERVVLDGPEVEVGGSAVTSVALLLHEIATNAAKYGSLSSPFGRVNVEWQTVGDELRLTWREEGGPAITGEPESTGFGSSLVEATVTGQFGGHISRIWRAQGLIVELRILLNRLNK